MLDAIGKKLQWLEGDLIVTADRQDTRLSAVRYFIRYLLDEIKASGGGAQTFHERCHELPGGDLVLAVNALDQCRDFIRLLPSNQLVILDLFCEAVQRSERFKAYCDLGAVHKAAFRELLAENKRDHAVRAAQARHARDPKQKDKAFVYECWKLWRAGETSYRSKAAFAKDMLRKFEGADEDGHITSQKKIEDWCREWEKS